MPTVFTSVVNIFHSILHCISSSIARCRFSSAAELVNIAAVQRSPSTISEATQAFPSSHVNARIFAMFALRLSISVSLASFWFCNATFAADNFLISSSFSPFCLCKASFASYNSLISSPLASVNAIAYRSGLFCLSVLVPPCLGPVKSKVHPF
jgi:hypothetical protein